MNTIQQSAVVSTSPASIWQVLINFDRWHSVFDDVGRVKVLNNAPPKIELQCTGTDGRVWHEYCENWKTGECITMTVRDDDNHQLKHLSRTWQISESDNQVTLTLSCSFEEHMPLVNRVVTRITSKPTIEQQCQRALDNVIYNAREQEWAYKETAQTILNAKGNTIISALATDLVSDLCNLMTTHRIGTVLILDDQGKLQGLVSERDIVYKLAQHGASVLTKTASDIMTRDLIVCEPQSDIYFVMACITDNKIRHLPVMQDGQLKGIVSIGDVVKQRMQTLEAESETLREYIATREWRYHSHHSGSILDTPPIPPTE